MNWFTTLAILILPFSVSAQTLLECRPTEGKFEVRELVVGNIVLNSDEVILFQQIPVFETVSFDAKKVETETTRTGTWNTYTYTRVMEEIITLQIEGSGKVRRAYLTRENDPMSDEFFLDIIRLKCFER